MSRYLLILCCFLHSYACSYVLSWVQDAQQTTENLNASSCDFRGLGDFIQENKINFRGAQLTGINFAPCTKPSNIAGVVCVPGQVSNLTDYDFSNATLWSANFQEAILKGADFTGADLMLANFSGADLTDAKLEGATNLSTAIFCNATMPDGQICSGESWTSKSGKKIACHCSRKK